MTDREKLVELIMKSGQICYSYTAEELADHLLANGVIVLPCKVGDKVYVINRIRNVVFENTVISLHCGHSSDLKNYIKTRWVGERGNESIRKWTFRQMGRYVFLTREEAEAALRKEGR